MAEEKPDLKATEGETPAEASLEAATPVAETIVEAALPEDPAARALALEQKLAEYQAKEKDWAKQREDLRSQRIQNMRQAQRDALLEETRQEVAMLRAEQAGDTEKVQQLQQEQRARVERLAAATAGEAHDKTYYDIVDIAKEMGLGPEQIGKDPRFEAVMLEWGQAVKGDSLNPPNPASYKTALAEAKLALEKHKAAKEKATLQAERKKAEQREARERGELELATPGSSGGVGTIRYEDIDPSKMTAREMAEAIKKIHERRT